MAMKAILVPVELHDLIEPQLEAAILLAKRFGSFIEGFSLSPALSPFLAADAMGAGVAYSDIGQDQETAKEARLAFEHILRRHGVRAGTRRGEGPSYFWLEETPQRDDFVGNQGRVFDITVIGQPGTKVGLPRMSTLEEALFESGRPVLLVPPTVPRTLGDNILVAWNGSTETARTISFALPLLRSARQVVLVTVEGGGVPGPTGEQVATYLSRNDIACEVHSIKPGARSTGEAILAEAKEVGSDLVIKGAYTQSRLRQMIFGGATRHIIAESTLPVFLAH